LLTYLGIYLQSFYARPSHLGFEQNGRLRCPPSARILEVFNNNTGYRPFNFNLVESYGYLIRDSEWESSDTDYRVIASDQYSIFKSGLPILPIFKTAVANGIFLDEEFTSSNPIEFCNYKYLEDYGKDFKSNDFFEIHSRALVEQFSISNNIPFYHFYCDFKRMGRSLFFPL
jgi:hypothetical protein